MAFVGTKNDDILANAITLRIRRSPSRARELWLLALELLATEHEHPFHPSQVWIASQVGLPAFICVSRRTAVAFRDVCIECYRCATATNFNSVQVLRAAIVWPVYFDLDPAPNAWAVCQACRSDDGLSAEDSIWNEDDAAAYYYGYENDV